MKDNKLFKAMSNVDDEFVNEYAEYVKAKTAPRITIINTWLSFAGYAAVMLVVVIGSVIALNVLAPKEQWQVAPYDAETTVADNGSEHFRFNDADEFDALITDITTAPNAQNAANEDEDQDEDNAATARTGTGTQTNANGVADTAVTTAPVNTGTGTAVTTTNKNATDRNATTTSKTTNTDRNATTTGRVTTTNRTATTAAGTTTTDARQSVQEGATQTAAHTTAPRTTTTAPRTTTTAPRTTTTAWAAHTTTAAHTTAGTWAGTQPVWTTTNTAQTWDFGAYTATATTEVPWWINTDVTTTTIRTTQKTVEQAKRLASHFTNGFQTYLGDDTDPATFKRISEVPTTFTLTGGFPPNAHFFEYRLYPGNSFVFAISKDEDIAWFSNPDGWNIRHLGNGDGVNLRETTQIKIRSGGVEYSTHFNVSSDSGGNGRVLSTWEAQEFSRMKTVTVHDDFSVVIWGAGAHGIYEEVYYIIQDENLESIHEYRLALSDRSTLILPTKSGEYYLSIDYLRWSGEYHSILETFRTFIKIAVP